MAGTAVAGPAHTTRDDTRRVRTVAAMALLSPDPVTWLDSLVFRVGPDAAFPGRPARLGQGDGSAFRAVPLGVVVELPTSAAHTLSRRALTVGDRVGRRERRRLVEFSAAVRSRTPINAETAMGCLARLAVDALQHGTADGGPEVPELVAAAFEVSALTLPSR